MRVYPSACAALLAVIGPAAAHADNPNDPAMRNAAARARDHAEVLALNSRELAMVHERDARYAESWRTTRVAGGGGENYSTRLQGHRQDLAQYERSRSQYQRDIEAWRRAVAACRSGDYDACQ